MAKLVLAYNFSAERLPALKLACMLVKVPLKVVPREQLLQPLGFLAGVPGVEPVEESYAGDEAQEATCASLKSFGKRWGNFGEARCALGSSSRNFSR